MRFVDISNTITCLNCNHKENPVIIIPEIMKRDITGLVKCKKCGHSIRYRYGIYMTYEVIENDNISVDKKSKV